MSISRAICLLLLVHALACQGPEPPPIQRAVYHWESLFKLSPYELDWMEDLHIHRIYLRLFDIDLEKEGGEPVPVGPLLLPDSPIVLKQEIVPAFFITNRTFLGLSEEQIDTLAARLHRKAHRQLRALSDTLLIPEWQFDCDWTERTREPYFKFLDQMRLLLAEENTGISATIRLHQVKYFERTGVPPVDRGMLMFYNVDDVSDPATRNSILDLDVAREYYHNFDDYPLSLDLALPLFRWGVVIREGKMVRIINGLSASQLADSSRFAFLNPTHAEVRKSTYLDGYYLYKDDQIRLESVPASLLQKAAYDLKGIMKRPEWVCLYHLAPGIVKSYANEELEVLYEIMEH